MVAANQPQAGRWGKAIKAVKGVGATPEMLRSACAVYKVHSAFADKSLTPTAIANNWNLLMGNPKTAQDMANDELKRRIEENEKEVGYLMKTANITGRETCGWCFDDGLVVVGTRPEGEGNVEMYGPCPHCEQGAKIEFPAKKRPAWGPDGYWQGRTPDLVKPKRDSAPLSKQENALRAKLLLMRWAGADVDPCEGLDPLLPERDRFMLLSRRIREAAEQQQKRDIVGPG